MPIRTAQMLIVLLFFGACSRGADQTQPAVYDLTTQFETASENDLIGIGAGINPGTGTDGRSIPSPDGDGAKLETSLWVRPAQAGGSSSEELDDRGCRSQLDLSLVDPDLNPVVFVLQAVEVAQADDQRCGKRDSMARACRALWMLDVLDPLTLGFDLTLTDENRRGAADALEWALDDAVDAAPSLPVSDQAATGFAFSKLSSISRSLSVELAGLQAATADGVEDAAAEGELADLVVARSDPAVVEPLALLSQACLRTG